MNFLQTSDKMKFGHAYCNIFYERFLLSQTFIYVSETVFNVSLYFLILFDSRRKTHEVSKNICSDM